MKKRKYLYRLSISFLGIVLFPMVIFILCFSRYSYMKVETVNEEYYEALMEYYMSQLEHMVTGVKEHAATLCADSKDVTSIFWEIKPQNNYWYYQAINEIKDKYHNYNSSYFGIYYYETDSIVSVYGKTTIDEYFRSREIQNTEEEEYLKNFFEKDNYEESKMYIGGTEKQLEGKNKILLGVCTNLGWKRDKVILFYEFTEHDIKELFETAYIEKGIECSLWNKINGFSFCFYDCNKDDCRNDFQEMMRLKEKQDTYLIRESKITPFVLLGRVNENAPQNITLSFIYYMTTAVLLVLTVVLLGCVITIYIAYKPVFRLTTKLDYIEGDEFETISNALDDRTIKIEEQEMLLIDLLLNNLLYRVPISNEKINQLGVKTAECYTVFLLDGYIWPNVEMEMMINEIGKKYQARMFTADLAEDNMSVFVFFLNDIQIDGIKEYLISRCESSNEAATKLVGGKIVYDIKEIWSCLSFCEEQLNKNVSETNSEESKKNNSLREKKRIKLKEDIMLYVNEHIHDVDLTQVSVAENFNVSIYTISRFFRNDVGIGFSAYINAKRVEYAKKLLLSTDENVHDIAVKSGFDNDNNFFKVFKANTGMSPTKFRGF